MPKLIDCIQIIKDGGWHFSYLKEPKEIIDKLEQFAHSEYNKKKYKDINHIKNSVKQGKDLLGRNIEFFKTEINKDFPKFLRSNIKQYKKWII
jgi:beta-1,4-mannosyl-glycoprotein beta-1,4-N-acetylglucosaminyltransferase